MRATLIAALALLAQAAVAAPAAVPVDRRSPNEIVAAAPAGDWVEIAPADLLVMDLASDRDSPSTGPGSRRVVIELMPPPFSQGWIGNIRALAAARWWDGTSVNRVQDNYVVQWGDADGEDKTKAKPLPAGLARVGGSAYETAAGDLNVVKWQGRSSGAAYVYALLTNYRGEMPWGLRPGSRGSTVAGVREAFSAWERGWAYATDFTRAWPVRCYATVGVGRDMPPDSGSGAELYAVIGQAPRQLDRNLAVVGRVIEGIEFLSSLPRGTGELGFYRTPRERVPIVSVQIGDRVPGLPRYEYLSTESASFAAYADARANRRDPFFVTPAGGADICNVPVPVRRVADRGAR